MRCLTLAEELKQNGCEVCFACRKCPGDLREFIQRRGYKVVVLSYPSGEVPGSASGQLSGSARNMLSALDWATDAEQTLDAIGGGGFDWMIVDHYALDHRWENAMRSAVQNLMVIDDLADRLHQCDLLLDQNLGREDQDYYHLVDKSCRLLIGSHYALLRPEFSAAREKSLNRRKDPKLKHILISLGGVDNDDATSMVLDALRGGSFSESVRVSIVLGSNAPNLSQVERMADRLDCQSEILVDVENMAQLMIESDFAIGAPGTTAWERCCVGLPAALVITAENQVHNAEQLHKLGAAILLGWADDVYGNLVTVLESLSPERLAAMSSAASSVTDGLGLHRVVRELQNKAK
jgi:UDP-2,4-diacetamido-2,4,6-trideoxy-beta-L-altropyranose hydrolase